MFSKIMTYFHELHNQVFRSKELIGFARKDIAIIREDLEALKVSHAAIIKTLSSIELEMLLQRNACLDNNFEGKQDL